jgi:hypothetical protein
MANSPERDMLGTCQIGQQNGNVQGTYLSISIWKSEAVDRVGDQDSVVGVGDAVLLDRESQARVRSKARVVNKVERKHWAKSGSSGLGQVGDGGNIESVAVVTFLEGHQEGDLGREALDVIANVDIGAPELLAGYKGGLMGVLHLLLEIAGT